MKTTGPTDLTKLDDSEIIAKARASVMNLSNMAPMYVHELTRRLKDSLAHIMDLEVQICNLKLARPSKELIDQMIRSGK